MTAAELKALFLVEYDAATSFAAPGWEDDEITSFLNIAQDSIVTELFKNGDLTKLSEILVTKTDIQAFSNPNGIENAVYLSLDDVHGGGVTEYFYYVASRTKVTKTDFPAITDKWLPNDLVERSLAHLYYKTPYNKLWLKNPKVYLETLDQTLQSTPPRFIILVDAYTSPLPSFGEVTYIKRPRRIDIGTGASTDLNESLHQLIAQLAVEQALKSIKIAKVANQ